MRDKDQGVFGDNSGQRELLPNPQTQRPCWEQMPEAGCSCSPVVLKDGHRAVKRSKRPAELVPKGGTAGSSEEQSSPAFYLADSGHSLAVGACRY